MPCSTGQRKSNPRDSVCLCLRAHALTVTPWTVAHQAPLSMGFSRQEYWSGLPFLLQGIFPTQGLNPGLPHCGLTLYRLSHRGDSERRPHLLDRAASCVLIQLSLI